MLVNLDPGVLDLDHRNFCTFQEKENEVLGRFQQTLYPFSLILIFNQFKLSSISSMFVFSANSLNVSTRRKVHLNQLGNVLKSFYYN